MNCTVCGRKAVKKGLCEKHYMKGVRRMAKAIDYWRIKGTPYKATHTRESFGFDGTYEKRGKE